MLCSGIIKVNATHHYPHPLVHSISFKRIFICIVYRVEGKIFYGHKIVLVTASPRFQSMLSSKLSEGHTPTLQINDIRYHIFQVKFIYLPFTIYPPT